MRTLLLLGTVAVLASCSSRNDGYNQNDDEPDTGATDWSVQLESRAGSQITGSANVQSIVAAGFGGSTAAAVSIGGATAGAQHPWHVHSGSCATGGPIMGAASEYPVLNASSNGTASATANLSVGLDDDGPYHINIHRSPSDLGTIVACGNLID